MKYSSFLQALALLEKQRELYVANRNKKIKSKAKTVWFKIVKLIEEDMVDKDRNFSRWLYEKDCIVTNPFNNHATTIHVGNNFKAIYYFLKLMKNRNLNKIDDDDLYNYACYFITQSSITW